METCKHNSLGRKILVVGWFLLKQKIFYLRSSNSYSSDIIFLPKKCFNKLAWLSGFLDSQR